MIARMIGRPLQWANVKAACSLKQKARRSLNLPDPGCHGPFIQLGDEMMLTKDGGGEYRTCHDPNAIGNGILRTLIDDAQRIRVRSPTTRDLPASSIRGPDQALRASRYWDD